MSGAVAVVERRTWIDESALPADVGCCSSILHPDHAKELRGYMRGGGGARGEASTFGAQMDRVALYAHHAVPCDECEGRGFVASKPDRRPVSETQRMMLEWLDINCPDLPPMLDRICPECDGCGYYVRFRSASHGPLTARMTGSSVRSKLGGSYCPDAADLIVGSRLTGVGNLHMASRHALEHYYAPNGNNWVALWHLTPSGKTMLKGQKDARLRHREAFANLIDEQSRKPTANRKFQFNAADEQARELLTLARRIWNYVVGDAPATGGDLPIIEYGENHHGYDWREDPNHLSKDDER